MGGGCIWKGHSDSLNSGSESDRGFEHNEVGRNPEFEDLRHAGKRINIVFR